MDGLSKARLFDREMSAVTHNLKEQRVLEKSLQTLKLEQGYALKLLQLDNRIIKVQYKKLKEKVSRIKSHLPAEDISKFRELDAKGKLKPTYGGVNIGSAVKIAAAARRLNLGGGGSLPGRRGVRSALPRIQVQDKGQQNGIVAKPPVPERLKRSSSVTGAFIDAPEPKNDRRPGSASMVLSSSSSRSIGVKAEIGIKEDNELISVAEANTPPVNGKWDSKYDDDDEKDENAETKDELTVQTDLFNGHHVPNPKQMWARRAASAHPRSHSTFSSHVSAEKDARQSQSAAPTPRQDRMRRMSFMSNDSIDSNLGENVFEERRQELLEEENMRAQMLEQRTKLFIKDVEGYLEQHPPLQPSHMAFETSPSIPRKDSLNRPMTADSGVGSIGSRRPMRFQRRFDRPGELDDTPTFFPEDQYRSRVLGLWKDMNKCRYLRVSDDKIDLSGVNTLVKDQMKLFDTLRTGDKVPLNGAWEA